MGPSSSSRHCSWPVSGSSEDDFAETAGDQTSAVRGEHQGAECWSCASEPPGVGAHPRHPTDGSVGPRIASRSQSAAIREKARLLTLVPWPSSTANLRQRCVPERDLSVVPPVASSRAIRGPGDQGIGSSIVRKEKAAFARAHLEERYARRRRSPGNFRREKSAQSSQESRKHAKSLGLPDRPNLHSLVPTGTG